MSQNPNPTEPPRPNFPAPGYRPRGQYAPAPKPKNNRWWLIGGAVALMAVGFGMGQAAAADDAADAPAAETVTKTETRDVEVTNPSCIEALDAADTLTEHFGEALDISADAIGNAAAFDWDAVDGNTAELEELTPKVTDARSDYDAASISCRAGAE